MTIFPTARLQPAHTDALLAIAQHAGAAESWEPLLKTSQQVLQASFALDAVGVFEAEAVGRFALLGGAATLDAVSPGANALRVILREGHARSVDEAAAAGIHEALGITAAAAYVIPVPEARQHLLVVLREEPLADAELQALAWVAALLLAARARLEKVADLKRSGAQTRAILETTVDGIITIDEHGAILTMNPAAERIFGYAKEEIIGCNIKVLMPAPYREEHDGYMSAYKETGHRRIIGMGREVSGRRKNGTTFPMELSVSEVFGPTGIRTFTGLVRDISDRRELEAEVLRIADEERRRIGQDLHDGLGQMLTGTHLIARGLVRQLEADGSAHAADALELAGLIKEADSYARALARGLVPVELEAHGLAAALKRLAANAERLFGIGCAFYLVGSGAGDVGEAPEVPAAAHLFRIAQEAVSNAVQHGRAGRVEITLAVGTSQVRLRVEDDGVGIDTTLRSGGSEPSLPEPRDTLQAATTRPEENRGMGVRIMHYRARIAHGSLEIRPGGDGGTTVLCTVPLHSPRP